MFKAYKYRLYPTDDQRELMNKHLGCSRWIYNLALETKIAAYQAGVSVSGYELQKELSPMKHDCPWLKEVDSHMLITSINNMDKAFRNFFKGAGFPKYKSRKGRQSYQCVAGLRRLDFEQALLTLPKMKNIPIRISRRFVGAIKTVTVSKGPTGKYYASILVDNGEVVPVKSPIVNTSAIGIDLGIKELVITSDGDKISNPKYLRSSIIRLKVLQYRSSKKKKGSANRRKANLRVALQHEKIANQRNDYLQKVTTKLVSDNQVTTFCVETLAVKNMMRNHKLAQAISDASWGELVRMLQYKCDWCGKNLIRIGRFEPSSKMCSVCSAINKDLKLSDRKWTCSNCGTNHDRDINAAINIKNIGLSGEGISVEPVEVSALVGPKKQEYLQA